MTAITLTDKESHIKDEISRRLEEYFREPRGVPERVRVLLEEVAGFAHDLHKSLKMRGIEPRHTRHMKEVRGRHGAEVGSRDFYLHIHPVQDLLKFVEDTDANRDPEDRTLGSKFRFTVYSRRWGHTDEYRFVRTSDGWDVDCNMYSGACDKTGAPSLYKSLAHDSINYPEALGGYIEYLWDQAAEEGLSEEEVQAGFDMLGSWVQLCEQKSPGGLFNAFK